MAAKKYTKEVQAMLIRGKLVVAEQKLKEALKLIRLAYKEIK